MEPKEPAPKEEPTIEQPQKTEEMSQIEDAQIEEEYTGDDNISESYDPNARPVVERDYASVDFDRENQGIDFDEPIVSEETTFNTLEDLEGAGEKKETKNRQISRSSSKKKPKTKMIQSTITFDLMMTNQREEMSQIKGLMICHRKKKDLPPNN